MEDIDLWPDGAPGSEAWTHQEQSFSLSLPGEPITLVRNVVRPTLAPVLPSPESRTGAAALICPGGGYFMLAMEHEGLDVAHWLADRGVAAFVLKYRVRETPSDDGELLAWLAGRGAGDLDSLLADMKRFADVPRADGEAAMRIIRERAGEWDVDPERVGVIGFSAGGRLLFDLVELGDRPRFAAAIYPAYPMGRAAPEEAPPLFLTVAEDDPLTAHSLAARAAWKDASRAVELHLYSRGGHGFGMRKQGLPCDGWIERLYDWLDSEGVLR